MPFDPDLDDLDGLGPNDSAYISDPKQDRQEIAHEDWIKAGKSLANKCTVRGLQWSIGDWLNQYPLPPEIGDADFEGESILDIAKSTLHDWASTAKHMPSSVRQENELSFRHHHAIANAKPDADEKTKKRWLMDAINEGWSVTDLKKAMRSGIKEPTFNVPKSFNVKIPRQAFETLHSIARGRKSTDQKVAAKILVEYLSSEEVKFQAAIELKEAKERTRRRRQRTAMAYDFLGLQR